MTTRKNALKSLLHIHDLISSNIRAFSAMFPLVIISIKTNFVEKIWQFIYKYILNLIDLYEYKALLSAL